MFVEIKQLYPTTYCPLPSAKWCACFRVESETTSQRILLIVRRALHIVGSIAVVTTLIWSLSHSAAPFRAERQRGWTHKFVNLTNLAIANASCSFGSALIDTQLIPLAQRPRMWVGLGVEAALTCASFLHLLHPPLASAQVARCAHLISVAAAIANVVRILILLDQAEGG